MKESAIKIMIVDDVSGIEDEFLCYCEESGHIVVLTKGAEALIRISETMPDVVLISSSERNSYGSIIASAVLAEHNLPLVFYTDCANRYKEHDLPDLNHYGLVYKGMSFHQVLTHIMISVRSFRLHIAQLARLQRQVEGMESKLNSVRAIETFIGSLAEKYSIDKKIARNLIHQFVRKNNLTINELLNDHADYVHQLSSLRQEYQANVRRKTPTTISDLNEYLSSQASQNTQFQN